jgi:hypothetical protein
MYHEGGGGAYRPARSLAKSLRTLVIEPGGMDLEDLATKELPDGGDA